MRSLHALLIAAAAAAGCFSKPDKVLAGDAGDPIDGAGSDAAVDLCIVAACGASGGTCTNGTCIINHTGATAVTCPPAMPCQVNCMGIDGCDQGVNCGRATECAVRCGATQCSVNGVDCANAVKCDVRCLGDDSCRRGLNTNASVECRTSACTVTCAQGNQACEDGIDVDPGGTCAAHCCDGACNGNVDPLCVRDTTCI